MNKEEAQRLIKNTLNNSFNEQKFKELILNIFNEVEIKDSLISGNFIRQLFQRHINQYKRICKYKDHNGKIIDVVAVKLKKDTSLDRARTMQRNFIAEYLKTRGEKDAALVAYYTDNQDDWRFSFIKMDYKFEKKPDGSFKVVEEWTPSKRYSFLVGKDEPSHTAQQQLLPLIENDKHNPTLEDIEEAFSIEKVTKEFFSKYKELYLKLKKELDKLFEKDQVIHNDFESKNINTAQFAKKLLGQIIFLYFLQKKGWLGVKQNDTWGNGPKNFLRLLFDKKIKAYQNFHNDILEPLFYEALAMKNPNDCYDKFSCKIPHLNGGLFEPLENYDWKKTDIILNNAIFKEIFDTFDLYNFTVREDEPLEKEVAVDPEMLGKVFENLLEVKDRKSKGAYYTPREIVHYMCQESLINYLDTSINKEKELISKNDLELFIKHAELVHEFDETVIEKQNCTGGYSKLKIAESIKNNAAHLDYLLQNIKLCDPAIGSGAFPVGMMMEIVKARELLTKYLSSNKTDRSLYQLKRDCIEYSIYGVDIDPSAVDIAKLRLWLSLVVDEEDYEQIQPLPNLDYKIVCGNSLLSVEKNLFNFHLTSAFEEKKKQYLHETNYEKKQQLKIEINKLILELTNNNKNFDFEIYFSEVFQEKGGFDVVIGNPPYIRADNPNFKNLREMIIKSKKYKTLYEKWDLFIPFIEQGLNLLGNSGFLSYITSNSLLTSKFACRLLEYIQYNYATQFIDYFTDDTKVFDAGVVPVVFGISKQKVSPFVRKTFHNGDMVRKEIISIEDFKLQGIEAFRLSSNSFKTKAKIILLGDICYLSYGLRPNSDERFWKGEFKRDDLISEVKDAIHSVPYVEGKNINHYRINKILYLEWGTERVPKKLVRPTFKQLYDRPKIMSGRVTGGIYDETGLVCNDSIIVFVRFTELKNINNKSILGSLKKFNSKPRMELEALSVNFDLKYILAILNSKFANQFLNSIRRHRLENYFYPDDFRKLPIADISIEKQKPLIENVNKILDITKDIDYLKNANKQSQVKEYEKQIDQMVYGLYGLTTDEIKIVEGIK